MGARSSIPAPNPLAHPRISVLIATFDRPRLLRCVPGIVREADARSRRLRGRRGRRRLRRRRAGRRSSRRCPGTSQVVGLRIRHAGRSAAKNHAVFLARAPIVLFFDDDDRAAPDYLERHLEATPTIPARRVAILGHTDWAPELELTPLMHYVTDVDRLMFAYERLARRPDAGLAGVLGGAHLLQAVVAAASTGCTISASTTRSTWRWPGVWPALGSESSTAHRRAA